MSYTYVPFRDDPEYRGHALADNELHKALSKLYAEQIKLELRLTDIRNQCALMTSQSKRHREYMDQENAS